MIGFVNDVYVWVSTNWSTIVEMYLAAIGLASIIVKLTPTLKDDDALKWVIKFLGKYVALNRSSESK